MGRTELYEAVPGPGSIESTRYSSVDDATTMELTGRQTQFYIDLIYGAIFAGGFSFLLFGDLDVRVAAFQGGLVLGYFLRVWERMSVYERILREEVAAQAEQAVAAEAEHAVAAEAVEAVAEEAEEAVADEAHDTVAREVASELDAQVEPEVAAEVERQVAEEMASEIKERVTEEVTEQVDREIDERLAEGNGTDGGGGEPTGDRA